MSAAVRRIGDRDNDLLFSAASIWEVAIKATLAKPAFDLDPAVLRRELPDSDNEELAITGAHPAAVSTLSELHRDPFDRILIAQAVTEGVTLYTADRAVLGCPGPILSAL